jgi:hypothetical protein
MHMWGHARAGCRAISSLLFIAKACIRLAWV